MQPPRAHSLVFRLALALALAGCIEFRAGPVAVTRADAAGDMRIDAPGSPPPDASMPAPEVDARVDAPTPMPDAPDAASPTAEPRADAAPEATPETAPQLPSSPDVAPPDSMPAPDATPPMPVPGLVSHWALDEGSGLATADLGSAGNAGTLSGAIWIPGKLGGALAFDGTDDFVELGTRNLPALNAPKTIAFWFFHATPQGGVTIGVAVAFTIPLGDGRLKAGIRRNDVAVIKSSGDSLVTAALPAAAQWHHFAYTFDGATNRLFIDGTLRGMSSVAPDVGAVANARLGAIHNNAENFNGRLDDVRVYNRALSADEVMTLANPP